MSKQIAIPPAAKRVFTKTIDQILKEYNFFRVSRMGGWKDNVLKIGIQPGDLMTPTFNNDFAQSRYVNLADKIKSLSNTKNCERIILEQGIHKLAGLEIIITKIRNKKTNNSKKTVVSKQKLK